MKAFWIELRTTRAWLWGLIVFAGWTAIDLLSKSSWLGSWREYTVWCAIPIIYLAPLMAAGAADAWRVRLTSGMLSVANPPTWRGREAQLGNLLADILALAVLPIAGASAVTVVVEGFSSPSGAYTPTYLSLGLIFAVSMVALGRLAATLFPTRVAAPLVAIALSLVMSLYGNLIPASNYPWTAPNRAAIYLSIALCALLLVGAELARARPGTTVGSLSRRVAAGTCMVLSVVLAFVVIAPTPKQITRVSNTAAVCEHTANGSQVCVWPDDAFVLPKLKNQVARLETITRSAGEKTTWLISEPGLPGTTASSIYPPGSTTISITPIDAGDGLWLTAESMAFGLANLTPAGCDVGSMSTEKQTEYTDTSWALIDVMSNYIYGGPRPNTVITSPSPGEERAVAAATAMDDAAQLAWIAKTTQQQKDCS